MSDPNTIDAGAARPRPFPIGSRLAGATLPFAAVAVAATLALEAGDAMLPRALAQALAIVDLLTGIVLLAGVRVARGPALVVVALGAALLAGFGLASGATVFAIAAVAAQAGIALLLAGTPRAGRVAGGLVVFATAWLTMVGNVGFHQSKKWFADATTDELPSGVAWGKKAPYRLDVPRAGGWRRLKDAIAHKKNAEADLWIMKQRDDAHVLVIAEDIEEGTISTNALADAVVKNARSKYTAFEEVSRDPLPGKVTRALQIHARGTVGDIRIEWLIGVFIDGEIAYQVHTFAPARTFASVAPELAGILQSFVPAREPVPTTLPEAPLALPVPIPPSPQIDGKDIRALPPFVLSAKARAAAATRDYASAIAHEHWAVAAGAGSRYNLACYHARAYDADGGFYWLQRAALEEGADAAWAMKDPDLESLRADKRWAAARRFLVSTKRYWAGSGKAETLLVVPKGYKKDRPIPVVVGLHGLGSAPADFACEEYQPFADALGVAFVGVSGTVPLGPRRFKWAEAVEDDRERIGRAMETIADRVSVAPGRIVLIGFSQGAQMAAEIAAHYPNEFAGAIIMSPGTISQLGLEDIGLPLADHRFVVAVGSDESPATVERAALDASKLRAAHAEVLHKAYAGRSAHTFPPDYEEALPRWVRFVLKEDTKK